MYNVLKDVLMIVVAKNGGFAINDVAIPDKESLHDALKAAAKREPQPTVFIRTESEDTNYESVGKLIYLAKRFGLESPVHFVDVKGNVVT